MRGADLFHAAHGLLFLQPVHDRLHRGVALRYRISKSAVRMAKLPVESSAFSSSREKPGATASMGRRRPVGTTGLPAFTKLSTTTLPESCFISNVLLSRMRICTATLGFFSPTRAGS